jgi:hypothetical protein
MEVFGDRDGRSPGHRNFGAARLGDARRTAALVATVDRILAHPPGTLPRKLGDPAALTRAYRLLRHPMVTHASVLAPHRDHTRRRMAAEPVVLVLHDTTELDYDRRAALAGDLGRIGNGSRRGLLCHNALAVTPAGRVLGLLNQVLHARRDVPPGEARAAKRAHPGRESRLWPRGVAGCGGDPPPGCLVVDVADRGADTIEFVHALAGAGRHFVIRSAKDRPLAGDDHVGADRVCRTLHAYARQLPALGWRTVRVHANRGRDARDGRDARVSVAAGPVTLAAPPRGARARGEYPPGAGPLDLWCACVREVGVPPDGAAAVEWVLLSDLPMRDLAEACARVDWYARRPLVEELHRAMKEGLGVEALRLGARDRLEPAIAILSAAAAILLDLRQAWADPAADRVEARASVPGAWVDVLSAVRGLGDGDVSLRRFALELAKLGGYLPRAGGRPGWQTLWRGWDRLNAMVEAVDATKLKRSG